MTDDQLARLVGGLRRPVNPDPEFSDALFRTLVAEVDFSVARPRRRGLVEHALGREIVAGRDTDHVACVSPAVGGEYWIDRQTHLIVKVFVGGSTSWTATSFQAPAALEPAIFDVPAGPKGEKPIEFGGDIPTGDYFTPVSSPQVIYHLGAGFTDGSESPHSSGVQGPGFFVAVVRPVELVDPTTGATVPFTGDLATLLGWLREHPGLRVGAASPVAIDGATGESFDLDVSPQAKTVPCESDQTLSCVNLFNEPGVGHTFVWRGQHFRAFVLDVRGAAVLILAGEQEPGHLQEAIDFVQTLRFP